MYAMVSRGALANRAGPLGHRGADSSGGAAAEALAAVSGQLARSQRGSVHTCCGHTECRHELPLAPAPAKHRGLSYAFNLPG